MDVSSDEFQALFLAEYPRVFRIAYRVLRDRPCTAQVAREVFTGSTGEAEVSPASLHLAAVELGLDRLHGAQASGGQGGDDLHSRVRRALTRMPRPAVRVLVLRAGRLSYAETAAALQVEEGQVAALLRDAEVQLLNEVDT